MDSLLFLFVLLCVFLVANAEADKIKGAIRAGGCRVRGVCRRAVGNCGHCNAALDMNLKCKVHDYPAFDPDRTLYFWPM